MFCNNSFLLISLIWPSSSNIVLDYFSQNLSIIICAFLCLLCIKTVCRIYQSIPKKFSYLITYPNIFNINWIVHYQVSFSISSAFSRHAHKLCRNIISKNKNPPSGNPSTEDTAGTVSYLPRTISKFFAYSLSASCWDGVLLTKNALFEVACSGKRFMSMKNRVEAGSVEHFVLWIINESKHFLHLMPILAVPY